MVCKEEEFKEIEEWLIDNSQLFRFRQLDQEGLLAHCKFCIQTRKTWIIILFHINIIEMLIDYKIFKPGLVDK